MISTSGKLTAQAFTSITIWPAPAVGRGSSPMASVSGPPVAVDKRAFIIFSSQGVLQRRLQPGPVLRQFFLIVADRGVALFGDRNLVEPFEQAHLAERVDLEGEAVLEHRRHRLVFEVDMHRIGQRDLHQPVDRRLRQHHRENPVLHRIAREDVRVRRRDDDADAKVAQCPGGMLAARPAAEIVASDQDRRALIFGAVEQIVGVLADRLERAAAHALARGALPPGRGDDDVGIDILQPERNRAAIDLVQRGHAISSRTSVSLPVTAAAAAIAGLTRWVRLPGPWRPTKLRLLVLAQRSPAGTLSGFIARHAEQPGSRHSRPASVKMRSRPSASAFRFTSPEPGTTIAHLTLSALWRPLMTAAGARRSSIRVVVELAMKIFSTGTSCIRVPG